MPAVAHILDPLDPSHGGMVTAATSLIKADGRYVARVGDAVLCAKHGPQTIVTGTPRLLSQGVAVAVDGSVCSCGAVIMSSSLLIVA
jgi:uncharacterized Zn-binding protein involved in type VI secretion